MNFGLKNKIALITGASCGIGRSEALTLADEGVIIYLTDIKITKELNQTVQQIKNKGGLAYYDKLDVTKENDVDHIVRTIVKEHENIDILINNASLTGAKYTGNRFKIINLDIEDWNKMI